MRGRQHVYRVQGDGESLDREKLDGGEKRYGFGWNYDCNQDERNDEMSKCMALKTYGEEFTENYSMVSGTTWSEALMGGKGC
ncbi:hypothetical protein ALC56_03208 [Trachymyrmex septentrionalis]|uniref:Uncharacterized protein n=1 Tax=Trachymyrmex septentrionalis TaxID=34720 RepID=A0A195FNC6_9HYME|nr:hypothetical protein ALC56_03208 [Trachymyrmex septentrionalis]